MTRIPNEQVPPRSSQAEGPDDRSIIRSGGVEVEEGQVRDSRALGETGPRSEQSDGNTAAEADGSVDPYGRHHVVSDSTILSAEARSHQGIRSPHMAREPPIPGHASSMRALLQAAGQEARQMEDQTTVGGAAVQASLNDRLDVPESVRQRPLLPNSEIAMPRIARQIPASFSGVVHRPTSRIHEIPSIASTHPYSSLTRWRPDSTGIWPAPVNDTNPIKKENVTPTPLPEVYRHHSHVADFNLNLSSRHGLGPQHRSSPPASEMDISMSENADSNRQIAAAAAAADSHESRRMTETDAEELYWNGFEDGIRYERQRQTLELRAGRNDFHARANSTGGADGASERQHLSPTNTFGAYRADDDTRFARSHPPIASHLAGYVTKPSYVEGSHNRTSRLSGAEGVRGMTERYAVPTIGAEQHRSAEAGREPHSWLSQPVNNPQRAPDHERWMSPSAFTTNNASLDRPSGSTSTSSFRGWGKVNMSCNQCRQRKTKCDGAKPHSCTACIKRRTADECTYAATLRRRGPGKRREGDGETDSIRSDSEVTSSLRPSITDMPQPEDSYDILRRKDDLGPMSLHGREKRPRTASLVDYGVGGSGSRPENWQDEEDNEVAC
ncbi:hypothetical protein QFC22_001478 [Naganishia vaughanmartiniae]|uniref:Uncharacterized protein n=1 Tax=Naganishia vaughanmartiniae TaxID=1424756 RepID=A0ACC2XGX7_9TREE|nr:hypothetical protein QFC22_001478 [Naganishia vaughanmartiniae]